MLVLTPSLSASIGENFATSEAVILCQTGKMTFLSVVSSANSPVLASVRDEDVPIAFGLLFARHFVAGRLLFTRVPLELVKWQIIQNGAEPHQKEICFFVNLLLLHGNRRAREHNGRGEAQTALDFVSVEQCSNEDNGAALP